MKNNLFIIIFVATVCTVFAQTKIANCNYENVLDVGVINENTPVIAYYTDREGFISTIREYFVDIGNDTFGPFDDVSVYSFEYSPNGKSLAYKAKIDSKYYVFYDKEKFGPFDEKPNLEFLPDGKTLAYEAKIDGKHYIFCGKKN